MTASFEDVNYARFGTEHFPKSVSIRPSQTTTGQRKAILVEILPNFMKQLNRVDHGKSYRITG